MEAAKRLDELGWTYLDTDDCLNCPACSKGKHPTPHAMPLFDRLDLAAAPDAMISSA